jgi:hypothetical protein
MAGEFGSFFTQPGFKMGYQGQTSFLPGGQTFFWAKPIDVALDGEDIVNATDGFKGQRRCGRCFLALGPTAGCGFKIGKFEELAPGVAPTEGLGDGTWFSPCFVEFAIVSNVG